MDEFDITAARNPARNWCKEAPLKCQAFYRNRRGSKPDFALSTVVGGWRSLRLGQWLASTGVSPKYTWIQKCILLGPHFICDFRIPITKYILLFDTAQKRRKRVSVRVPSTWFSSISEGELWSDFLYPRPITPLKSRRCSRNLSALLRAKFFTTQQTHILWNWPKKL